MPSKTATQRNSSAADLFRQRLRQLMERAAGAEPSIFDCTLATRPRLFTLRRTWFVGRVVAYKYPRKTSRPIPELYLAENGVLYDHRLIGINVDELSGRLVIEAINGIEIAMRATRSYPKQ